MQYTIQIIDILLLLTYLFDKLKITYAIKISKKLANCLGSDYYILYN